MPAVVKPSLRKNSGADKAIITAIMEAEINLTPTASLLDVKSSDRRENGDNGGNSDSNHLIPARSWGLASECTAGALLVHGLGGHSAWFEALGRRLKVQRMFVVAYDQLGFGKRNEEKFASYSQWLDDLCTVFDYHKSLIGDKPLFIFANSMGAAVSLKACAEGFVQPAGLALFSPGLGAHPQTFPLSYRISTLYKAWTQPDRLVNLPYGVEQITGNEPVRARLLKDNLMRTRVPARMMWELLKMTSSLTDRPVKINCPVVMFNAGIDQLVDTAVNQQFFNKLQTAKTNKDYPNAWHDLMFDPVLDDVVQDLTAWMDTVKK
ncbi:MAG TPA: alpha/beta fold hydrolase [Oculatellaceae cyanobacterium]